MKLFTRIRIALLGPVEELYVDPLIASSKAMDDMHAQAVVEDRQRSTYKQLRSEHKSLLNGYTPPEPFLSDRIDAQAVAAGHVMPSDRKRTKRMTSVKPSLLNTRKSANS